MNNFFTRFFERRKQAKAELETWVNSTNMEETLQAASGHPAGRNG